MARGHKSAASSLTNMIRILQVNNDLAPQDPLLEGEPVSLDRFAQIAGLSPEECVNAINKINYGCGDALPAAYINLNVQKGLITPSVLPFAFDGLLKLTKAEACACALALRTSGIDQDGHLSRHLQAAFPQLDLIRLTSAGLEVEIDTDALVRLEQAVAQHRVVRFDYRKPECEPASREVEPLGLWFDSDTGTWLLEARTRDQKERRTFRIDRICGDIVVLPECFEDFAEENLGVAGPNLDDAQTAVLAFHDPSDITQQMLHNGLEAVVASPDSLLSYFSQEELDKGACLAKIGWLESSSWLVMAVVQGLGRIEVIAPSELRARVASKAQKLLEKLM